MGKPIPPGDQSVAWKGTVVGADEFAPPQKKSRKKWAVIGVGGALAAGIAAYALWPSSAAKPGVASPPPTTPLDAPRADAAAPPDAAAPIDAPADAAAPIDAPEAPDKLVQPKPATKKTTTTTKKKPTTTKKKTH